MDEVIVDPPATSVMINAIRSALEDRGDAAQVTSKVHDGRCVRVTTSGGSRVDMVLARVQVTVDAYDALEERAEALANLVGGIVRSLRGTVVGGVAIYEIEQFALPGNLPDPVTERPRWTQTFIVGMRARVE